MQAPLVNVKGPDGKVIGQGYVIPPWNSWFQQFSQPPAAVQNITVGASPFAFQPNDQGQVVISGGAISLITLTRGSAVLTLFTSAIAIPRVVLVSIGDIVTITYSVKPVVEFLEL
jgi:hypothetical protein